MEAFAWQTRFLAYFEGPRLKKKKDASCFKILILTPQFVFACFQEKKASSTSLATCLTRKYVDNRKTSILDLGFEELFVIYSAPWKVRVFRASTWKKNLGRHSIFFLIYLMKPSFFQVGFYLIFSVCQTQLRFSGVAIWEKAGFHKVNQKKNWVPCPRKS